MLFETTFRKVEPKGKQKLCCKNTNHEVWSRDKETMIKMKNFTKNNT